MKTITVLLRELRDLSFVPLALFLVLSSVYLLTYHGLFRSIDELAMFSMSESLVQTHTLQTPQLGFAPYHNPVGRIEPFQSFLAAPLYWLAVRLKNVGNIQTVMLLNIFFTSATGVLLYLIARELGYSDRVCVSLVLCYGLGTIAWPYALTFFREPLLAFLLSAAYLCFVRWRNTDQLYFGFICSVCLILGLITKLTSFVFLPAFLSALFLERKHSPRQWRTMFLVGSAFLLIGIMILGAALSYRSNSSLSPIYARGVISRFSLRNLVVRGYGLLFSPGKGLFVFSPLLLLGLAGLPALWSRHRTAVWAGVFALIGYTGGYTQYGVWHGGLCWGPRHLVPIVPLLLVPLSEVLRARKRAWRVATFIFIALSISIQFVTVTVDYTRQNGRESDQLMFDFNRSPVIEQFRLWRLANLDLLWWHTSPAGRQYFNGWLVIVLTFTLIVSSLFLLYSLWHKGNSRIAMVLGGGATIVWLFGLTVLLTQAPLSTPGYPGVDPAEMRQIANMVNIAGPDSQVIITVSNEFHLNLLLNYLKGHFIYHWLSPAQVEGFEPLLESSLSDGRVSLIVDRVHIQPDQTGREMEWWLNRHLYRYLAEWAGSGYELYHYLCPDSQLAAESTSYRWGEAIELRELAWGPRTVHPGQPVRLEFTFYAAIPVDNDYSLFVQLLSPDGTFVVGTDGAPQFGAAPTSTWAAGDEITDRRAFFVPADASPGRYTLIAGLTSTTTPLAACRLPVRNAVGQLLGDHLLLGPVEVSED